MAKYYEDEKIIEALKELSQSPFAQGFGEDDTSLLSTYYHNGVKDVLNLLIDIFKGEVPDNLKIKEADVRPLNPGIWRKGNDYYWYCSKCGSRHTKSDILHSKYCPDCGALLYAKGDA